LRRKRNKVDIKDIKERGMVRSIKSIRHRSRLLPLKYSKKLLNLGSLSGLCDRTASSLEHFNICELSQSLNMQQEKGRERLPTLFQLFSTFGQIIGVIVFTMFNNPFLSIADKI